MSNWNNCLGAVKRGSRILEFQFNRQYDTDNDIWYKINNDFLINEWTETFEYNVITNVYEGDPRQKDAVEDFKELITFVFKDSYNHAFYNELSNSMDLDNDILALGQGGLNLRVTTYFDDIGESYKRYTFLCCSAQPSARPWFITASNESAMELILTLNNEPYLIESLNVTPTLPATINDVAVTTTAVSVLTGTIDYTLDTITDVDGLLLGTTDNIRITVIDKATGITVDELLTDSASVPLAHTFLALTPTSEYLINTAYLYENTAGGKFYRSIDSKTVTAV